MNEENINYTTLSDFVIKLTRVIDFMTPNVNKFDRDLIQSDLEHIIRTGNDLAQINVFQNLEALFFSPFKMDVRKIITRIRKSLGLPLYSWRMNYNEETFKKASEYVYLYESTELKLFIYGVDGIINSAIKDIDDFEKLYLGDDNSISNTVGSNSKQPNPIVLENNEITSILKDLPPLRTESIDESNSETPPQRFNDLFFQSSNSDLIEKCICVLREINPPLIDTDYNYIGKSKGAICIWVDEMVRQGITKHIKDRKIYAKVLQEKIKRFSIDESMFGKHHKSAEEKYRTDFKNLLSKIKLSHPSQKGNLGK